MGLELASLAMAAGMSGEAVGTAATIGASLPSFATAASIGSSVISGIGAIQQGRAQSAAAGYNAQVAANNAQIAQQNAAFAGAVGEQNTAAATAKTRAQVAATIANEGASGVDINTGSALGVRESEAKLGMLNALNIRSAAARQAYGYQTQSAADIGQSRLYKSEQTYDTTGGYLNAGADILGGVGKAYQYNKWLGSGDPTAGITRIENDANGGQLA